MRNVAFSSAFLLIFLGYQPGYSQNVRELEPGYYVVVAAYGPGKENFAQHLTNNLNRKGIKAEYGFNSRRNFYFVFTHYFNDLKTSLRQLYKTRKSAGFSDAWVRVVSGDMKPALTASQDETSTVTITSDEKKDSVTERPAGRENVIIPQGETMKIADTETLYNDVTDNPEIIQYEKITLGNTEVFLSLFNATNNRIVDGMVKVVDTEKAKLIKEVNGNDYMYLPDPKNKSGQITLICEAFGYRKVQQEINYPLPLADTVKEYIDLMGTTFIIYFDLIRYQIGDKATLYHVYFFNDAAVMLPESKYELNTLLQMMQENSNYRIRLHGHTNGNYHGKIIMLGPDQNFFSLNGSKNSVGSAKDLARARAETIKTFLVSNGIAADRIEVKSWGGKKPIYDKHGANARKNVRVEVEILQD